jgi:hypothetical protein
MMSPPGFSELIAVARFDTVHDGVPGLTRNWRLETFMPLSRVISQMGVFPAQENTSIVRLVHAKFGVTVTSGLQSLLSGSLQRIVPSYV